jgi:hypothetical protein
MARPTLRFQLVDGPEADEDVVRACWLLRLEMLTLHRPREADWAHFHAFVTQPNACLFTFRDTAGEVQGFFTILFIPVAHPVDPRGDPRGDRTQKGLLLYSKYFYFRAGYRGHPKTLLAPWMLVPIALRRFGVRRLHFVSTTYPQSFVSLSRSAGNVVALASPDITPWKAAALRGFAETFYPDDFDLASGVVLHQNVPDSPSVARSPDALALGEVYERLNPRWREGRTLPILFSVDATLVRTVARRTLRRVRPRSNP